MPRTIAILLIIILLIAGGWFIYYRTRPSSEEIESQKTQVLVVPKDILADSVMGELKNFKQYGTLPIVINSDEQGRDDPFADF